MYSISVTTTFHAAHQLVISGDAEPHHAHNWTARAAVGGKLLDENGLLFDFNTLKKTLDEIVIPFNNQKLEDMDCFSGINTSAENLARYIYEKIIIHLPKRLELLYVEVTETPGNSARYSEKMSV